MVRIATTPGLEERLRSDPALIPPFIEEVLRLEAPVQGLYRRALKDIEIAGVPIAKGSTLVLRFGAGNRDPSQFREPSELDLARPNLRNHLTFGAGPHFCLGNQLARGELRIAIATLLRRIRNIRLSSPDALSYMSHFLVYGPHRLEIAFDPV